MSSDQGSSNDKRNWRDVLKGVNLEAQLNAAGAPPWVADTLKKVASLSADAAGAAGEKLGKTLNTVQMPITISKEILRESIESVLDNYTLDLKATVNFRKKTDSSKGDPSHDI